MIDVRKLLGIDCSGPPPWRYIDDVFLSAEEQVEFVRWIESLPPLFYRPSQESFERWRKANAIVGIKYGRDGDIQRIEAAKQRGEEFMGVVFGRQWFAVIK